MNIKKIALCSLLTASIITSNNHCLSNNFDEMSELKERYYSILELNNNQEYKVTLLKRLLSDIKDLKPSLFEKLSNSLLIGLSASISQTLTKSLYEKPSTVLVLATIISYGLTGYSLELYAKNSYERTTLNQFEEEIISELASLE
jgi:hypothetical protein